MEITIEQIKQLREETGAGIMDCRAALTNANGDYEAALTALREKGLATAAKRAERIAADGVVELYDHGNGRVGVMVEVNCETDFVGKSEDFRHFAHEMALQVAAMAPLYVSDEDIDEAELEAIRSESRKTAKEEGKPENIIEKIVEGRIEKFKNEKVLLRQHYIRNDEKTVQDLLNELVAKMGEKILIRRIARWELGELSQPEEETEA